MFWVQIWTFNLRKLKNFSTVIRQKWKFVGFFGITVKFLPLQLHSLNKSTNFLLIPFFPIFYNEKIFSQIKYLFLKNTVFSIICQQFPHNSFGFAWASGGFPSLNYTSLDSFRQSKSNCITVGYACVHRWSKIFVSFS